jgi:hypothetical protein
LQGRSQQELVAPIKTARQFYAGCKSSLAKAWLNIAFRCYGEPLPDAAQTEFTGNPDILLCAIQALEGGNYGVLKTGAMA